MYNNKRGRFGKGLMFLAFLIGVILLLSLFVMQLWNTNLPAVLHVSTITYSQALGILVLSKILFGGFPGRWGGRRNPGWYGMKEKLAAMTPEEREKFKENMGNRCGRKPDGTGPGN